MHACMVLDMTGGVQDRPARAAPSRRLVLDTTVASLVKLGYSGTTDPAVDERAALSRGAQLGYFGT